MVSENRFFIGQHTSITISLNLSTKKVKSQPWHSTALPPPPRIICYILPNILLYRGKCCYTPGICCCTPGKDCCRGKAGLILPSSSSSSINTEDFCTTSPGSSSATYRFADGTDCFERATEILCVQQRGENGATAFGGGQGG